MIFFKSTAQKGREYSHWIDLTLNSHFEAVISEIYRTKVRFLSKSTFFGSTKRFKKVQKGPAAPKPICLCHSAAECKSSIDLEASGKLGTAARGGPRWGRPAKL